MKKILLLTGMMAINIYSMNDDMNTDNSQGFPEIWIGIKWRIVPSNRYTLPARIKAITRVTETLATIAQRVNDLPFDGDRKTILVTRLQEIVSHGLACKQTIENTPLDPESSFSQEASLKAIADSFLVPYHRSENELRTQVEVLEQMVHDQNAEGVEAILARLEALQLN